MFKAFDIEPQHDLKLRQLLAHQTMIKFMQEYSAAEALMEMKMEMVCETGLTLCISSQGSQS